jgi:pyruvate dehydrogenase E1 component beta subunit
MRGEIGEPGERIPLGQAKVARSGEHATVIAYGGAVGDSLAVAARLAQEGIEAEVIDLRTISPWDRDTVLSSVARTKRAVVVHEAVRQFGVGAEISATIGEELFGELAAPVRRVASKNLPVPFSPALERAFLYSRDDIEQAVRSVVGASR